MTYTEWTNRIYNAVFPQSTPPPKTKSLYRYNNLVVKVDVTPIGGFRDKAGAVTISHREGKVFTEWTDQDLDSLARVTQKILKIQEQAHVHNTLIFGKQDGTKEFKLSFIPYPIIFGSPTIQQKQIDSIAEFYREEFKKEYSIDESLQDVKSTDPFCNQEVIERQEIDEVTTEDNLFTCRVLHDNTPKGVSKQDPHLLIVPKGGLGHVDGSKVRLPIRLQMVQLVRDSFKIFIKEKFNHFFYLERIGPHLQGVHHKHSHAVGIKHFPDTFFAKIMLLIRLAWPSQLSSQELKEKVKHYQELRQQTVAV